MSLSTCTKCGGHIPLGPHASNCCESCGAGVFAAPSDQPRGEDWHSRYLAEHALRLAAEINLARGREEVERERDAALAKVGEVERERDVLHGALWMSLDMAFDYTAPGRLRDYWTGMDDAHASEKAVALEMISQNHPEELEPDGPSHEAYWAQRNAGWAEASKAKQERDHLAAELARAREAVKAARAFRKSTAEYLRARHSGNTCGIANLADDELWLDRALAALSPPADHSGGAI